MSPSKDPAQHPGHSDTHGVHGMLVLGGQRTDQGGRTPVYVSHLPMFGPPHDFQVILRVGGAAAGKYAEFVNHFGAFEVYTFEPEPFSITELDDTNGVPSRTSFTGNLYRGHFERGGSQVVTDTPFEVEQVVHFRRFSADAVGSAGGPLSYLCFGEPGAMFLAHFVTAPPDFDQILAVDVGEVSGLTDDDLRAGVLITVRDRADVVEGRLQVGDEVAALVVVTRRTPALIKLTVSHEVYKETGDLAG